jgi:hypothetical protein
VTIENDGNAALSFPIPVHGTNPSIPPGFTVNGNAPLACPLVDANSSTAGILGAGASCQLSISFSPQSAADTTGWLVLTDDALNQTTPSYATHNVPLIAAGASLTATITWAAPPAIAYGTALSANQLNASATVSGSFAYSPAPGSVLGAGSHKLTATFTPSDTADFRGTTASVTLVVNQVTPTITWTTPSAIVYGKALSATQLNATASVPGAFSYSSPIGAVLNAGSHTITATFTPTDTTDYTSATAAVTLTVNQATPTITWAVPAAISYGTPLGAVQLNASSTIPGSFAYSQPAGTVLSAAWHTITATFTPTDTVDYTEATTSVTLVVTQATPMISWPTPAAITYGTALSSTQLDATTSVPGTFSYSPPIGAVLSAFPHTITAAFTPTDFSDYNTATASVTQIVNKAQLTVAANNLVVPYNQAIPPLTYTVTGFVNGDTSSELSGAPSETTTAKQGSPGNYPITITLGTLTALNYNFSFVNGTLTITPPALQFIPVTPCRVADTRNATEPFGGPEPAAGSTRTFNIPQSACNIPSTAVAYSLNVTVVPNGTLRFLTMWPTGQAQPTVSTLNSDGRIKANAAIVSAGTNGGVNVYVTDATQVILDIDGYFVPAGTASALAFYPLTPCRVADTRNATGPLGGPSLSANTSRAFPVQSSTCHIPATALAYSLNITAVPHGTLGYLTTWPTGQAQPTVSTLNSPKGVVTASAALVPAGMGGEISVYVSNASDVVLDVNGYFAPPGTGGLSLYTVTPCRIIDTRTGAGAFNGTLAVNVETSACAPPATAQAYVLNATVVPPGALGFLTLWAAGQTQPVVSTLNAGDGAITSNMAIVPTTNGSIDAFPTNKTNLVLDISSYFAP